MMMIPAIMRRVEREQDENNPQAVSKTKGWKQYDFRCLFRKKKTTTKQCTEI